MDNQNIKSEDYLREDDAKLILSFFQWSYGGYMGPLLAVYENGRVICAVNENPDGLISRPKIKTTVISANELSEIKKVITNMCISESSGKTFYNLCPGTSDLPALDIVCNVSSKKYIRIEGCLIKNKEITFYKSEDSLSKPDEIPDSLDDGLKILCKLDFKNLQDNVPEWIKLKFNEDCKCQD